MKLTPAQAIIAKDTHRFRVVNCGRRFGKTTLAVEEIKGKAVYRESRIAYFALTYQQARDIAWLMLIKQLAPVITKQNESRLEIEVRNLKSTTSVIQLRGWESVETARGQAFDFIVIDEVASMKNFWSNWQEVLRPTLTDKRGEVLFISTPKGFNHFYDLYNLQDKDKSYQSFHFTSYDNPWLPKDEINEARSQITEDRFAQEYLADFRKTEGLVYKEFDRKYHLFDTEPQRVAEYIGGIDFGFTNPASVIHIKRDTDDGFWVMDEWYKTKRTEEQIADYVASCRFNKVYPDPENPSAIEVLNQKGISTVEVIKGKDSVKSGINKVRELLKQDRLHIHKNCVNLISEFETYSYPDKKPDRAEDETPIKEHDHCLVGDTLITIANGRQKKLRKIKVGELVKTQYGTNKVLLSRLTRKKVNVCEIELSNGYKLKGTEDHKIYTDKGKMAIDTLRYGDIIEVLENKKILLWEKQSHLINKNILGTVDIMRQLADIKTEEKDYIKRYGNITMGVSQKDFTSIIKTETELTTKSLTSDLLKLRNTYQNIFREIGRNKNLGKKLERIAIMLDRLQKDGTLQSQALNGTDNTEKMVGLTRTNIQKFVKYVEKNIKLISPQEQDFAITIVKRKRCGQEDVYNLTVENDHNYYANGILVANCLDALRYAIMGVYSTKISDNSPMPQGSDFMSEDPYYK